MERINLKNLLGIVFLFLLLGLSLQSRGIPNVTFQQNILPLLKTKCTPCHFEGGKVYDRLPFDDYQTVYTLRSRLNTRLKTKGQQSLVNRWIQSGAKEK